MVDDIPFSSVDACPGSVVVIPRIAHGQSVVRALPESGKIVVSP